MDIEWTEGVEIRVCVEGNAVVISANREGLLSLSKQFAAMADEAPGFHIHYDEHNALEDGSADMIVEIVPKNG